MTSSCIGVVAPFSTEEAIVAGPLLAAVEEVVAAIRSGRSVCSLATTRRDPDARPRSSPSCSPTPGCLGLVGPKNSGSALVAAPLAAAAGPAAGAAVRHGRRADRERRTGLPAVRSRPGDRGGGRRPRRRARRGAAGGARRRHRLRAGPRGRRGDAAARSVGFGDAHERRRRRTVAFLAMGEVEQAVLMRRLRDDGYGGAFLSAEGGPGAPIAALAGDAAEGSLAALPRHAGDGTLGVRGRSRRRRPDPARRRRGWRRTRSAPGRSTARPDASRSRPPVSATASA